MKPGLHRIVVGQHGREDLLSFLKLSTVRDLDLHIDSVILIVDFNFVPSGNYEDGIIEAYFVGQSGLTKIQFWSDELERVEL